MEINNKIETELDKTLKEIEEGEGGEDETEPEPIEPKQETDLEGFKEHFSFESPKGFKISSASCSRPVEYLAQLVHDFYHTIQNGNPPKEKGGVSYTG